MDDLLAGEDSAVERMAGAIVYYIGESGPLYLLLKMNDEYRFPQRRTRPGETVESTVVRSVLELVGITELFLIDPSNFRMLCRYPGRDPLLMKETTHQVVFLLGRAKGLEFGAMPLGRGAFWLTYDEAIEALAGNPFVEVLEQADKAIREYEKL